MPSPLIQQLNELHGYPWVTAANRDAYLEQQGNVLLFFTEDPKRYPESNDVAVILPELAKAFPASFDIAVVARELEPELKAKYDIKVWPTLVFLRDGRFLGKITKIRDWSEYMERIPEILNSVTTHNPGIGIPLVEDRGSDHA